MINKWLVVGIVTCAVFFLTILVSLFSSSLNRLNHESLAQSLNQAPQIPTPTHKLAVQSAATDVQETLRKKAGGWEIFDSKKGYSIKYPPDWKIMTGTVAMDFLLKSQAGEVINVFRQKADGAASPMLFLEQNFTSDFSTDFIETKIDGLPAARHKTDKLVYILLPNGEILTINYLSCSGPDCGQGQANPEVFDIMLASFQGSR